jgi:exosome complex RNA-binding protein Csl4
MYTSTTLLPTREDLERATTHRWIRPDDQVRAEIIIDTVNLTVEGDDVAVLAATLHRLADELTAAHEPETVYSEAQAATL